MSDHQPDCSDIIWGLPQFGPFSRHLYTRQASTGISIHPSLWPCESPQEQGREHLEDLHTLQRSTRISRDIELADSAAPLQIDVPLSHSGGLSPGRGESVAALD